jgi:phosphomannomutase
VDEGLTASAAAAKWPTYDIVKVKVDFPRESLADAYVALEADLAAGEVDRTDGLRLAWPGRGAWLHVRPSGTEPIVRLIAEARDASAAQALVDRAAAVLGGVI